MDISEETKGLIEAARVEERNKLRGAIDAANAEVVKLTAENSTLKTQAADAATKLSAEIEKSKALTTEVETLRASIKQDDGKGAVLDVQKLIQETAAATEARVRGELSGQLAEVSQRLEEETKTRQSIAFAKTRSERVAAAAAENGLPVPVLDALVVASGTEEELESSLTANVELLKTSIGSSGLQGRDVSQFSVLPSSARGAGRETGGLKFGGKTVKEMTLAEYQQHQAEIKKGIAPLLPAGGRARR